MFNKLKKGLKYIGDSMKGRGILIEINSGIGNLKIDEPKITTALAIIGVVAVILGVTYLKYK